ncbi:MAG: hypothetical protein M1827_001785 [Pycnora praestabilis]|nr:MAG: hypothetical protein M1827_001785 [Pycnora praestabilis]
MESSKDGRDNEPHCGRESSSTAQEHGIDPTEEEEEVALSSSEDSDPRTEPAFPHEQGGQLRDELDQCAEESTYRSIDSVQNWQRPDFSSTSLSPPSTNHISYVRRGRSRSRKRKLERDTSRISKSRRLKGFYSDSYRQLLNESIEEATNQEVFGNEDRLASSQIGITIWTSEEKNVFFNALARLGRDHIQDIAALIGTKSEYEVQEYEQLLRRGMIERYLNEPRHQLLGPTDLPAAFEITEECCVVLDRAGEALNQLQQRHEEKVKKGKSEDLWLLTPNVAVWVEACLKGTEEEQQKVQEALPAVGLLRLEKWLELSERIFMNPAPPEEDGNWRTLAEVGERPSIHRTAFSDFHTLAVSISKRLIQSTLYFAMSRLRATDSRSFHPKPLVRKGDVKAALRVLGMKADSNQYWAGAARRCGLDVYANISVLRFKTDRGRRLRYDEVESNMSIQIHESERSCLVGTSSEDSDIQSLFPSASQDQSSDGESDENNLKDDSLEVRSHPSKESASDSSDHSDSPQTFDDDLEDYSVANRRKIKTSRQHERDVDIYTAAFDQQASRLEEQRLWEMLDQVPPFDIKPEDVEIPNRPPTERKSAEDLVDWKDRTQYIAEWEMFPQPVPEQAWNRPKRRDVRADQLEEAWKAGTSGDFGRPETATPSGMSELGNERSDDTNSEADDHIPHEDDDQNSVDSDQNSIDEDKSDIPMDTNELNPNLNTNPNASHHSSQRSSPRRSSRRAPRFLPDMVPSASVEEAIDDGDAPIVPSQYQDMLSESEDYAEGSDG